MHKFYQGFLHWQRIIPFYGVYVNAMSFTSIRNVPVFTKLIKDQQQHMQISYIKFRTYQTINVECTDRNIFTPTK